MIGAVVLVAMILLVACPSGNKKDKAVEVELSVDSLMNELDKEVVDSLQIEDLVVGQPAE